MSEWQPIETAPKDGTIVLVIDENGEICLGSNSGGKYWSSVDSEGGRDDFDEPTYWMTLPAPPEDKT